METPEPFQFGAPLGQPPKSELFGASSYQKGALFVTALRQHMGEEAFNRGLRAFFARYGGSHFTRADFQREMESAAGHSLKEMFSVWLEDAKVGEKGKVAQKP